MNLYHLKYFYDSARLGSLTKAAKLNHVGQPAISKGIQNIEAVFNKSLISHERNRFQLTEDGEVVFSYCEKIFSTTDELKDSLTQDIKPTGAVRFACPSSLADSEFLANAIRSINTKYPNVSLKLMLGRTDLIRDWVNNGVCDFGILLNNVDLSGFKTETLASGFFHLIKSCDYTDNWREVGVMTVENKREVFDLKKKYADLYGKPLKIKMEIGSWGVIKRFVMAGLGVGFVPDYMIQNELREKSLSKVEQKALSIPYEIQIVRKADKYVSNRGRTVISEFLNL